MFCTDTVNTYVFTSHNPSTVFSVLQFCCSEIFNKYTVLFFTSASYASPFFKFSLKSLDPHFLVLHFQLPHAHVCTGRGRPAGPRNRLVQTGWAKDQRAGPNSSKATHRVQNFQIPVIVYAQTPHFNWTNGCLTGFIIHTGCGKKSNPLSYFANF